MKLITLCMVACLFMMAALAQATTLKVGDKAPDFTLPDHNGNQVRLNDFQGKQNVILAFYVLAFTGG